MLMVYNSILYIGTCISLMNDNSYVHIVIVTKTVSNDIEVVGNFMTGIIYSFYTLPHHCNDIVSNLILRSPNYSC